MRPKPSAREVGRRPRREHDERPPPGARRRSRGSARRAPATRRRRTGRRTTTTLPNTDGDAPSVIATSGSPVSTRSPRAVGERHEAVGEALGVVVAEVVAGRRRRAVPGLELLVGLHRGVSCRPRLRRPTAPARRRVERVGDVAHADHRRRRGRHVGGHADQRRPPRRRGRSSSRRRGSRATRRAASRSSSAVSIAGGVDALVARSPGGAPPARHRRAHQPRGDGDRPRRRRGRGARRARRRASSRLGYDELLIATGGEPVRPDLPGIDLPLVHGVQSLADAQVLLSLADDGCRRIVIVGGGYIGLEMAEAYIERGCTATVSSAAAQPLGVVDERLRRARRRRHARPRHRRVAAAPRSTASSPTPCCTPAGDDPGRPRHPRHRRAPAQPSSPRAAGIELGAKGAIRVDERQATNVAARVGGRRLRRVHPPRHRTSRCTSPSARTPTATAGSPASTWPAATPARRGCSARRSPSCATLEVALTGVRLDEASDAGFDAVATTIDTTTVAGYLPHATADDGAPRRRARHRAAARRPDHRRPGRGQAHRHRGHGDHRRHDRRRRDGPRPRLRPAVLVGVGSRSPSRPGRRSKSV